MLILQNEEIGKLQIARALGHETVSGELNKQIKQLITLGMIEMTIPDIPNSRLQKYRLTTKGLELMINVRLRVEAYYHLPFNKVVRKRGWEVLLITSLADVSKIEITSVLDKKTKDFRHIINQLMPDLTWRGAS